MSTSDQPLIVALGDLIGDVVVELESQYRPGTDTQATITRRRGGSAANVAAAAAAAGARGRFVGRVGADPLGDELLAELDRFGVEAVVERGGRTGSVVSIVHLDGERSLLTDRGSAGDLTTLPPGALEGASALHVPLYALAVEPLASLVGQAIETAVSLGVLASVDASSVPVVEEFGAIDLVDWCVERGVSVLFCNDDEYLALDGAADGRGDMVLVHKRGPHPAVVHLDGDRVEVPATAVADVVDSTGAGDAFAAGTLASVCSGADWVQAVARGHQLAAKAVSRTGALRGVER